MQASLARLVLTVPTFGVTKMKVEIDTEQEIPYGMAQVLVRTRVQDRRDVKKAADTLGMSQSQFIRNTVVNAARQIIAQQEIV